MDDLTEALAGAFSVSNIPNNPAAPHPRFSMYKQRGSETSQEKRRRQILKSQKDSRYDFMQHIRRLAENLWEDMEEDNEEEEEEVEEEDYEVKSPAKKYTNAANQKAAYSSYRPGRYYKDQLMMSEWLVEVPEDFQTEWVMVPCPVGKRNLVVASNGGTTSYSKGGWKINNFPSKLPGGSKGAHNWRNHVTVLDTLYNELTKTYYVLDMMCWKEMPLYECDTDFRFFWLHDKLGELGTDITTIKKGNPYRFEPLPNFSCELGNIERTLQADMKIKLDGLLFFHRKTHYVCGTSPVALWLKAYMLPEILGVPVPQSLLADKPNTYTTFQAHTVKVKEDKEKEEIKSQEREEKRKEKRRSQENRMDVSGSGDKGKNKEKRRSGDKMEVVKGQKTKVSPMDAADTRTDTVTESKSEWRTVDVNLDD